MPKFILNRRPQDNSGDHEVHDLLLGIDKDCLPDTVNWIMLGYHDDCHSAITAAKSLDEAAGWTIDGCYYCANDCHER